MFNYKKLLGDTVIFAIGNLGSKLLLFLLVPFYTHYLSTSDFGLVDLITVTINLLFPIFTLSIYDAVLRFVMDQKQDTKTVVTNGFLITISGTLLVLFIYPILKYYQILDEFLELSIVILLLYMFQPLLAQFMRAIGDIKKFAFNGILTVLVTGISNIIFLAVLDIGIYGYFYSIIIGLVVSNLYLFIFGKVYNYICLKRISLNEIAQMLKYSIPLIPNSLSLWLTNAANRYFILLFIGANANGLYAVASKIPSLLNMLNSIFFQAWQLSAIEEYESKNKSHIFTSVFKYFSLIIILGTSAMLIFLKPTFTILFADEYYESWKIVPFLLMSTVFFSFASFIGTNYIAAKQTKGVTRTTIIGSVISIVLNFVLIPSIGVIGAGISVMVSNFVLFLIRLKDTKKFVEIKINYKNLIINLLMIQGQIIVLFINFNSYIESFILIIIFLMMLIYNNYIFVLIVKIIKNIKKKN